MYRSVFTKAKEFLLKCKINLLFFLQYVIYIYAQKLVKETNKPQRLIFSNENILILVPHADDELIGCFQLLKTRKCNIKLFYLGYTGINNDRDNKIRREAEIKELAEIMQVELIIAYENHSVILASIINIYDPKYIFTPSIIDWNYEHLLTNIILNKSITSNKMEIKICQYQISIPIAENFITHYTPMSIKELRKKWEIFRHIYKTQKHLPTYRFKLNERLSGTILNIYAAEVYSVFHFYEWKMMLEKSLLQCNKPLIESTKIHINNIKKSRLYSNKIYNEIFKT